LPLRRWQREAFDAWWARRAREAVTASARLARLGVHRKIHATLDQRFSGPNASASVDSIMQRRQAVLRRLERDRYDGLR